MKNQIYILEPNWSYCGGGMVVVAKDKNSIVKQIHQSEVNALEKEENSIASIKKIKVFNLVEESKGEERDWIIIHILPTNLTEQVLLYNYNYA